MYHPTGTNLVPLGRNRFSNDSPEPASEFSKRPRQNDTSASSDQARAERKRKRKSRWGDQEENEPSGLPTTLPRVDDDKKNEYILKIRIEEINRKLRNNDVVPPERLRSPSPEPVYDSHGKRVNTREVRYRKKLEDERHKLVEQATKTLPNFVPPADYRRPTKLQDKVYIPAKEFPEINFIGLLIGPRGKTLKGIESDTGVKISIRGRGSIKEGKSRGDSSSSTSSEDDLHCLVMADDEDKIKKAVKMINKIIETSASTPEGQNELKRNQLRELAALNGTLRDDEAMTCLNCGAVGHRRFECPERPSYVSNMICRNCGGHGHIARDCHQRDNPQPMNEQDQQLDAEYMNLMAELGERPDGNPNAPSAPGPGSHGQQPSYSAEPSLIEGLPEDAPDWQRDPDLANAPWHQPRHHHHHHQSSQSYYQNHQQSSNAYEYDANAYYYGGNSGATTGYEGYEYDYQQQQPYAQDNAQQWEGYQHQQQQHDGTWNAPPPPPSDHVPPPRK
ncbi:hypothetical protein DM01DRAFT_1314897 [Hesseltinella vesiculosa]|uniref:Branchpoint-bridging protein n=1 Tax=Hesseltinella vesiculosa TaxID=101127 RepID=A0A1X2GZN1_9FUNG|nr:hypothetical protein DM01DRAFT_1314897 [Hesseltinella vesiculosa]